LIPNVAEKNILILVEKKKKFDSEFLSYNLMLNSGKKIRALRDKKKYYSNSGVVFSYIIRNILTSIRHCLTYFIHMVETGIESEIVAVTKV
jgi:hypothetical protein